MSTEPAAAQRKKKKVAVISDVELLAIMVTRILGEEHCIDSSPTLADYTVQHFPERYNGSSDIRVAFAIGRGVTFDITQHWPSDDGRDLKEIIDAATEIADNITALEEMRGEIMDMCIEVRASVRREIAGAKRRGVDYRLVSAQPFALWDSVRDGFAVNVVYERLSEYLRMEPSEFSASDAPEVTEIFAGVREEQERRAIIRANLNSIGATGRIDSVVVNALREAGHNVPQILQRLAATDDWILDVGERGGEKPAFTLHWKSGNVYGHITLDDNTSWHEGRLWFKKVPISFKRVAGKRLSAVVGNDTFGDIRIRSTAGKKGEWGWLNCERDLLYFDAETGRLWAA